MSTILFVLSIVSIASAVIMSIIGRIKDFLLERRYMKHLKNALLPCMKKVKDSMSLLLPVTVNRHYIRNLPPLSTIRWLYAIFTIPMRK